MFMWLSRIHFKTIDTDLEKMRKHWKLDHYILYFIILLFYYKYNCWITWADHHFWECFGWVDLRNRGMRCERRFRLCFVKWEMYFCTLSNSTNWCLSPSLAMFGNWWFTRCDCSKFKINRDKIIGFHHQVGT